MIYDEVVQEKNQQKKIVLGIIVLLIALVSVWHLFLRGGDEEGYVSPEVIGHGEKDHKCADKDKKNKDSKCFVFVSPVTEEVVEGEEESDGKEEIIKGCTNPAYQEYRSKYTEDTKPTSCEKKHIVGCTDKRYEEYDRKFTKNRKSDCKTKIVKSEIKGCTDPLATNYNPDATKDDGSCIAKSKKCTFNHDFYSTGSLVRKEEYLRNKIEDNNVGKLELTTKELNDIKSDLDKICKKVNQWKVELTGCTCNRKVRKLSMLNKSKCK